MSGWDVCEAAATELICQGHRSELTVEVNSAFEFSKVHDERFHVFEHVQPCMPGGETALLSPWTTQFTGL